MRELEYSIKFDVHMCYNDNIRMLVCAYVCFCESARARVCARVVTMLYCARFRVINGWRVIMQRRLIMPGLLWMSSVMISNVCIVAIITCIMGCACRRRRKFIFLGASKKAVLKGRCANNVVLAEIVVYR